MASGVLAFCLQSRGLCSRRFLAGGFPSCRFLLGYCLSCGFLANGVLAFCFLAFDLQPRGLCACRFLTGGFASCRLLLGRRLSCGFLACGVLAFGFQPRGLLLFLLLGTIELGQLNSALSLLRLLIGSHLRCSASIWNRRYRGLRA